MRNVIQMYPLSPVSSVSASVGPCASVVGTGEPIQLKRLDALDLAMSKLDEAEKLFYAGEHDAALSAVGVAHDVLDGIR